MQDRPSNIAVRTTTLTDIDELASTMRQEDVDEIWHLARARPNIALLKGYLDSKYIKTVLLDGHVVCIFGVAAAGTVGIPWMLASPLLKSIRKQFLRESRLFLEEMMQPYEYLTNLAWSKNHEHIRWLKWLGFQFKPARPLGPDGELFIEFYKVK